MVKKCYAFREDGAIMTRSPFPPFAMYTPAPFRIDDPAELQRFVHDNPLATLVIRTVDGVDAIHVPLVWRGDHLLGHFAKGNPAWQALADSQVLAVFHHPGHYISANWYPGKARDHRVVPTWNYQAVHMRGELRFLDEAAAVRDCLAALVTQMEATETRPWTLEDAPTDFIDRMSRAIRCFRIDIQQVEGKYKLSQNQNAENRDGVRRALQAQESEVAQYMAALVRQYGK